MIRRLLIAPLLAVSLATAAETPPNILLILADDMGSGDVQALNPDSKIPTPHLNKLASQGAIFTDAHRGSAVCTPTRYGLLTGRYAWRTHLKAGVLFPPNDKPLIENDRVTIANFLKSNGYRTAMVGKWHLGIGWARDEKGQVDFDAPYADGPIEKGFDQFFGVAASLDMIPYVFVRDHQAVAKTTDTQVQLGFPKFIRKGPKDHHLLDESDQGFLLKVHQANFVYRGTKADIWEAGHRVPFFVRWPKGNIKPGTKTSRVTCLTDILPTLAEITGAKIPADQVEGRSFLPLLNGTRDALPDRFLFTQQARWKTGSEPNLHQWTGWSVRNQRFRLVGDSLFDMIADPGQKTNVAEKHPDLIKEMRSAYNTFWKEARPLMVNEDAPMSKTQPYHLWYDEQMKNGGIPDWTPPTL